MNGKEYVTDIEWGYGAVHIDEVRRDEKGERRYYTPGLSEPWGDRIADDRRSYPTKEEAAAAIRIRLEAKHERLMKSLAEATK